MGDFPCPRCLVPKENLKDMGTKEDMLNRINNRRVDDTNRRSKIDKARKFIYGKTKPLAVNGQKVEGLLKSESLVPTLASEGSACILPAYLPYSLTEHLLCQIQRVQFQLLLYVCRRLAARI